MLVALSASTSVNTIKAAQLEFLAELSVYEVLLNRDSAIWANYKSHILGTMENDSKSLC